jgi:AcrR family transcriptional regulator
MRKSSRHHGNLRVALVDAGLELLARDGIPGLTLRACAARTGVSHAAPAHHFDGLPGLLTAIAARGHSIFTETMVQDRNAAGREPRAALIGICRGYLRFARENPALFTLMFNHSFNKTSDPDFTANSGDSYAVLAKACAPFQPVSDVSDSTEAMIWSLVHGLACLLLGNGLASSTSHQTRPDITDILPVLALKK